MFRINLYRYFIPLLTIIALIFLTPANTFAQTNMQAGENITLQKNEVINKDFFAAGDKVTILGTVNGDAYLAGGKIVVDGVINGDLIAAGGELTINGKVTQNIRAAGGNINLTGPIGRNATILGGNINFAKNSEINGSLVSAGGNINLYAPIGKDLYIGGGDVTVGNSVGGDINAGVGNLTFNQDSSVSGNLTYISEQPAQILEGATISGQIKHTLPPKESKSSKEVAENTAAGFNTFYKAISFSSLLILGLLIINFFPRFSLSTSKIVAEKFWVNLLVGLLSFVIVPLTFVILFITLLGIPLAFILLFGFLISLYLSKIFISIWLGNFISARINQSWNLYISFLIGLSLLTILSFIPIFGFILSLATNTIGLGALLVGKKTYYLKLKKEL